MNLSSIALRISGLKMLLAYFKNGKFALHVLIPFASTYLCESGFSALFVMKTKAKN